MHPAVIIPTFNRAAMVEQAVESALGQSVPVRVVVVDDGSTDDTSERLARFGERIIVHRQENAERGVARNRGAALAGDAPLLIFLDADDWMETGHVASLLDAARAHPEHGLLASAYRETDPVLSPLRRRPQGLSPVVTLEAFLAGREPLPTSTLGVSPTLFRAVGGFPERRDLAGSEDWLFVGRALALGPAHRTGSPSVLMRKHPGNSMANARAMHGSMLLALDALFGADTPESLRPPAHLGPLARGDLLVRSSVGYYAAGDMQEARRLLLQGVRTAPSLLLRPLPWWTWVRSLLGRRISSALRSWKHGARRQAGREGARP